MLAVFTPLYPLLMTYQQVIFYLHFLLNFVAQALLIHSFKTQKLYNVKYLAAVLLVILQLSLSLGPSPTLTKNFVALFGTLVSMIMMLMLTICYLLCQITNSKYVMPFVVINLMLFNLQIILKTREGNEIVQEVVWYVGIEVCTCLFMIVFVRINQDNALASVSNRMQLFEFEQYYDIFNCLQEGIIVFDQPTDQQPDHRVFFANEIMQFIMTQVLKLDEFDLSTIQAALNQPIFYQYRSDNPTDGQRHIQHASYSLNQIFELSEDELSQRVFMFSDKQAKFLETNN